jgi:multidrug/hemolysin transport system permease protein
MVLLIMGLYFVIVDGMTIPWAELPMVGVIMVLSTATATALNAVLVQGIKKLATLGAVSTVISTAAGFLVGTYVPIGALPDAAQVLIKCTPGAYIAALYRDTLMSPTRLFKIIPPLWSASAKRWASGLLGLAS